MIYEPDPRWTSAEFVPGDLEKVKREVVCASASHQRLKSILPVTAGQWAEQGKLGATPLALEVLTFSTASDYS